MLTIRTVDSTDVSVNIRIIDAADGTPETGVVFNTTGIDLKYRRGGTGALVNITEATLATVDAAHSDGGIIHISGGTYRLDLPDAACSAGVRSVLICGTITDMIVLPTEVLLTEFDHFLSSVNQEYPPMELDSTSISAITDHGDEFWSSDAASHSGTLQAATAGTATLGASASSVTDFYKDQFIELVYSDGSREGRFITAYNGTTKVATLSENLRGTLSPLPDYQVFASDITSDLTVGGIADAVWDEATAGHTTSGTFGEQVKTDIDDILVDTSTTLDDLIDTEVATLLTNLATANAALVSLATAVNTIDDLIDTEVAAIKTVVDAILLDTGTDGVVVASGSKTGYELSSAGVDAILDEAIPEPAGVFSWPASLRTIGGWIGALSRNKVTQSESSQALRNDADNDDIATAAVSDEDDVATRGEWT